MTEKFDLKPAEQCTKTETGHFGELMKEVYQGQSGLLARQVQFSGEQQAAAQHYELSNSRMFGDGFPAGPALNSTEMVFDNKIYSVDNDKHNLKIGGKDVSSKSSLYKQAVHDINSALHQINFDAPACPAQTSGLWQSLDRKN